MKLINKILISILFYFMVALGSSLIVKANVGMDAFYAFTNSLSVVTSIKIGTLVAAINGVFIVLFIILSKGKFIYVYILQIVSIVTLGSVINLLTYQVFNQFELTNYVMRLIFLVVGLGVSAISIGVVTVLHVITFPVEATCYQLEKNKIISFMKARYGIDVVLFVGSIAISYFFSIDYFIREGTLIAMLMFSLLLNASKSFVIKRLDQVQNIKIETIE